MLEQLKLTLGNHLDQYDATNPRRWQAENHAVYARQPIFTTKGTIWGYELLYRRPTQTKDSLVTDSVATASVIVNGYGIIRPCLRKGQKLLMNFSRDLLEAQVIKLLPPEVCVAEILEDVVATPRVLKAVGGLKDAGYKIAVDDYTGQKSLEPFLPLADILKIDVLDRSASEVAKLVRSVRKYSCTLLAEKVENKEMAETCRSLGFDYFQGFYFSRPENVRGKKATASYAARTKIMSLCASPDVDLKELTEAVLHDAVITSRFLRFANSPYFGLPVAIKSIHHALLLVGRATFMQWLAVNVLASLEASPVSRDMSSLAAQRAKFLEILGAALNKEGRLPLGIRSHDLFLTGLFSLLSSLLDLPLEKVLEDVPLDGAVVAALNGDEASVYSPWLRLMECYEDGDWEQSASLAQQLGLKPPQLASAYTEAMDWSVSFFNTDEEVWA